MKMIRTYLAGPMRNYPRFNFDRFEEVAQLLERRGCQVRSPHRMDIEIGFNPNLSLERNGFSLEDAVRRDVEAIIWCNIVVLLEGWEKSTGANAERAIAAWLGRDIYAFEDFACLGPT